jgi:DNA polymerase-3 subunit delta'
MLQLSDIFGQDDAISWIRKALAADHLPHGLIFAGPVGVGKATTAAALGALFLCENPKNNQWCGKCESCRVMAAGNHPDFHVITKELIRYHDKTGKSKGIELSIHVVRPELIEPAARKANMGRGKVFVVEQAELMNPQAQNALLKTLEEPAGRTLIILLTDQPNALLQTIRSRCQIVRFAALDQELVRTELQKRGLNKAQATNAAKYADGSLGVALKWHEEGVVDAANELVEMLQSIESGKPATDIPAWFKKSADAYAEKQLERDELASKDQATREGLGVYLRIASQHFREQLAEEIDSEELERRCAAIDAIIRAEEYLDANVNIPLIFQQLAIALEMGFSKVPSV